MGNVLRRVAVALVCVSSLNGRSPFVGADQNLIRRLSEVRGSDVLSPRSPAVSRTADRTAQSDWDATNDAVQSPMNDAGVASNLQRANVASAQKALGHMGEKTVLL